jgi:hypothetical protein
MLGSFLVMPMPELLGTLDLFVPVPTGSNPPNPFGGGYGSVP